MRVPKQLKAAQSSSKQLKAAQSSSKQLKAAQGSNIAEAAGESDQAGEAQEFEGLVNELNEGKYEPGFLSRVFIKLKAFLQRKDYKTELAIQSLKKMENKAEFLKAAFKFIKTSSENETNRDENVQTLLLLCTRYCSSLSKGKIKGTDAFWHIGSIIEKIENNMCDIYNDDDLKNLPGKVQDAYDEFLKKSEEALENLNADFNRKEAKNDFQTLVDEFSKENYKYKNFLSFLDLLRSPFFNTKEGIVFAQQCYKEMSNGIKFLETVFDRFGPIKNAAEFPGTRNKGAIKNLRNFLRFCEKGIDYNEWFGDGGVRSRFSNIENLPNRVNNVFKRIDSRLYTKHK